MPRVTEDAELQSCEDVGLNCGPWKITDADSWGYVLKCAKCGVERSVHDPAPC